MNAMSEPDELVTKRTAATKKSAWIAGTTVLGLIGLTAPFVFLPTAKQGLPYMATPAHKLQKALKFVQQRRQQQQQQQHIINRSNSCHPRRRVFVDLGSGDGEGVYQAVQLLARNQTSTTTTPAYFYDSCIGIELNTTLYLLSNLRRRFFWTSAMRARSQFQCRDFWTTSELLRTADTILVFGVAPLMRPLSAKLRSDCLRAGTHILSYRFPLPVAEEQSATDHCEKLVRAILIYDEGEMRIYECINAAVSDE